VIFTAEDFFSGVEQKVITVGDLEARMPVKIKDSRIICIYCLAPVKKLRRLLPDGALAPAQMLPGMGLVQTTVYDHRDSDIGPFKELSVVIPLYSPEYMKVPLYNLRKAMSVGRGYNFLLHRAADSELAVRVLDEHYLYPEFPVSVEFTESADWLTGEVKDGDDLICRLRGRKIPADNSSISRLQIYTPRNQKPNRGDINFKQLTVTRDSSAAELTLGSSHPVARELSETIRSTKSSMYVYAPSCQFVLHEREESS
jgi:hypothetical protein